MATAKAQKPLRIGVFGPESEKIMASPEVGVLRERGDTVEFLDDFIELKKGQWYDHCAAVDIIIGTHVLRTNASLMKLTLTAIESLRKRFPKPPSKAQLKKEAKAKGEN